MSWSKLSLEEVNKYLQEFYGMNAPKGDYYINSKGKVRFLNKTPDFLELNDADTLGLYIGTIRKDRMRLSLDGSIAFGKYATKNIIEINKEQLSEWMQGKDFELIESNGYKILKYKNYFVGCCKIINNIAITYVRKNRRVRNIARFLK